MSTATAILLCCILCSQAAMVRAQSKIVGGQRVAINDYPYLVSIRNNGDHSCMGAIIRPATILTAAHCVYRISPNSLSVRAGSGLRTSGGTVVSALGYRVHPNFSARTLNYDAALLYLSAPLTYSTSIRPIGLFQGRMQARSGIGAAGWGTRSEGGSLSNVLYSTVLQIQPRSVCRRVWGRALGRGMFCAGGGGRSDTCQGDSGGPVTRNARIIGITSFGNGCARRGRPGIYTRIPIMKRWINRYA